MGTALNDGLRCLIGVCLRTAGVVAEVVHRLRASNYARSRAKLGRRLGIGPETRLATELPEAAPPQPRSPRAASKLAYTSGTGAVPKRLEYSSHRLAWVRWVFIESFLRVFWMLGVRRTSLYVFGPLEGEESLTGLLLSEERVPGYLTTLQAPYRIQAFPALRRLAETYGAAAVRLWILALSNPGVLYSTNPSTMSSFLDRLDTDWQRCSALVRDCVRNPERVGETALWVTRRLASHGHLGRLERIADSPTSVPITEWAPAAGPEGMSRRSSIDWPNTCHLSASAWFRCTPCLRRQSRRSRTCEPLTWRSCPWPVASTTNFWRWNRRGSPVGSWLRTSSRSARATSSLSVIVTACGGIAPRMCSGWDDLSGTCPIYDSCVAVALRTRSPGRS